MKLSGVAYRMSSRMRGFTVRTSTKGTSCGGAAASPAQAGKNNPCAGAVSASARAAESLRRLLGASLPLLVLAVLLLEPGNRVQVRGLPAGHARTLALVLPELR